MSAPPVFRERLTGRFAPEARWTAGPLLAGAALLALLGLGVAAVAVALLGGFVAAFFRNPGREIPGDERTVVSPADGRVIAVGEVERPDGSKALRIGIFLSVFNVHVNRAPLAGRVVAIERSGDAYLAAFNPDAETRNVRCAMTLEGRAGERIDVVQITGLIARRIICQPEIGEWLSRGIRYGLIRFGSRTDVLLPLGSRAMVASGDRVRGGSSPIAELAGAGEAAAEGAGS